MVRRHLLGLTALTFVSGSLLIGNFAQSATQPKMDMGNAKVPVHAGEITNFGDIGLQSESERAQVEINLTTAIKEDTKRKPSSSSGKATASEDMMSAELKAFRDKLTATREAEGLEKLLAPYNDPKSTEKYDAAPNDLKYVIARLSPMLALRGITWRLAPLAAHSRLSQESLLATARSFAEQVMIVEPNTQWQAYIAYFSIPSVAQMTVPFYWAGQAGRTDATFKTENDAVDFMYYEARPALARAIKRMETLNPQTTINGKTMPLVFDNKIRFGSQAFNQTFDAVDRFAFIGRAETLASAARFYRRISTIDQLMAYNWNGNIALRKYIGRAYGVDVGSVVLSGDPFAIDGLTRDNRVSMAKKFVSKSGTNGGPALLGLRNPAKTSELMLEAYNCLSRYASDISKSWEIIKKEDRSYDALLDPDLFVGREEQINVAVADLNAMMTGSEIRGAVSGEKITVNMKNFFENPPSNLTNLMPTQFAKHEDIAPLKSVYQTFTPDSGDSRVSMMVGGKKVQWRNYLYGRATGWDAGAYSSIFPGVNSPADVGARMRVLAETRGGRPIMNSMAMFIK